MRTPIKFGRLKVYGNGYEIPRDVLCVDVIAALVGKDDEYASYAVLDINKYINRLTGEEGKLRVGDYISVDEDYETFLFEEPFYQEELDGIKEMYNAFVYMHTTAPYTVKGYRYSEEKDEVTGRYKEIESVVLYEGQFDTLKSAEQWLFENYPSYYIGSSISQNCPSGSFSVCACPEYFESLYNTTDRTKILEHLAKENGWSLDKEALEARYVPEEEVFEDFEDYDERE